VEADRIKSLFSPIPAGEDQEIRSSEEGGVSTDRRSAHGSSAHGDMPFSGVNCFGFGFP
jgi:hypothetical protein